MGTSALVARVIESAYLQKSPASDGGFFLCLEIAALVGHKQTLGAAGYVLQSRVMTDLIPIIEQVLVGNGDILPDASAYDLPPKHR